MNLKNLIALIFAAFLTILAMNVALADDESTSNQSDSSTQTNSYNTKPYMYDPTTDRFIYRDGSSRQRMWYDKEEPEIGPSPYTYRTIKIPQYRVVKKTKKVRVPRSDDSLIPNWFACPLLIIMLFFSFVFQDDHKTQIKKKSTSGLTTPIFIPPVSNSTDSDTSIFTPPEPGQPEFSSSIFTPPEPTPPKEQFNFNLNVGSGNQNDSDVNIDIESIRQDAQQGDMHAQSILGEYYENGFANIPKDQFQAVKWTWKAANQGDADAQCRLGTYYENGMGVQQDPEKALDWYQKAANQGHANALFNLGMYYLIISSDPQEWEQGMVYLQKAADQGHDNAIAIQNEFGATSPQDLRIALINLLNK